MKKNEIGFPKIEKTLKDFINDEDGNISRNRLVSIGAFVMLMTVMSGVEAFAVHSSHSSHVSHSSTAYVRNHTNHASHSEHASHASHTSHSNTVSHSNSAYSAEGDVEYGPSVANIPIVDTVPVDNSSIIEATKTNISEVGTINVTLPEIPEVGELPNTPNLGLEFEHGALTKIAETISLVGGVSALAAGTTVAAKQLSKGNQGKNNNEPEDGDDYVENSDEIIGNTNEIDKLIKAASLPKYYDYIANLKEETIFNKIDGELDDSLICLDKLQRALESDTEHNHDTSRFTDYFIPETLRIILTYKQYVDDEAPTNDMNLVFEKVKESVAALNAALKEKAQNIYQYSTMDAVAKAEALNRILAQDKK